MSKEQVDHSEATKVDDFPLEASLQMSRGSLILGLSEDEKNAVSLHPEAFITYKLTYRCKHCAKEWVKVSIEEIPLPREYVAEEPED